MKDFVSHMMTDQIRSLLDEPLSFLNHQTPRQCIGKPEYRKALTKWVHHLEQTTRRADGKDYGFGWLRNELRLDSGQ